MSKKVLSGIVISDKMEKSIVVSVKRTIMHPIYKKFFKSHKKFMAHDPENQARLGDVVRIEESRPLSKNKRWSLLEIVSRSESLAEDLAKTNVEVKEG